MTLAARKANSQGKRTWLEHRGVADFFHDFGDFFGLVEDVDLRAAVGAAAAIFVPAILVEDQAAGGAGVLSVGGSSFHWQMEQVRVVAGLVTPRVRVRPHFWHWPRPPTISLGTQSFAPHSQSMSMPAWVSLRVACADWSGTSLPR